MRFYIKFSSYWSGSPVFFAGPFESVAQAEAEISSAEKRHPDLFVRADLGQRASDPREQCRIWGVFGLNAARKSGMRDANTVKRLMPPEEAADICSWE